MKTDDLNYLCASIGNLSGIPVRLYDRDKLLICHSIAALPADPIRLDLSAVMAIQSHVGYHINSRFYCYGVVVHDTRRIVIGPSRLTASQDQELREMAFQLDIPADDVPEFVLGMKQIRQMPLEGMMQMLCAVNFVVNGEKLTLNDMVGGTDNAFGLEEARAERRMAEETPGTLHNSLAVEQTIMNIIRKGDVAALEAFVGNAPVVRPGVMAADQLRQAKNTFIAAITQASRSAIRGGMDVEDALSASDAYIRQCEMMTDIHQITMLHYDMVLYYTRQVQRIRMGHYPTELVIQVANYVQHHLSEPITTDQIAEHLFLSRQHLSRRFTKEAGIPLAAFVRNEKVEEAKRLLRYTDKSVMAISTYLGFSSQGHFSGVFKEATGMTPGEYRDKKHE
ncbi:MAG: helix-turn-helix domain-containing protein [Clostridia bacterium]|nr:helix-turn-helix domain-containing protein [Clostridia bacterium]